MRAGEGRASNQYFHVAPVVQAPACPQLAHLDSDQDYEDQSLAGCHYPMSHQSRPPVSNRTWPLTGGPSQPMCGGNISRRKNLGSRRVLGRNKCQVFSVCFPWPADQRSDGGGIEGRGLPRATCGVWSHLATSVSPKGVEPTLPSASRWCLLPLGYEDVEPLAGSDPAAFRLRGGSSATELQRRGWQVLRHRSLCPPYDFPLGANS